VEGRDEALTVQEAARLLKIGRNACYEAVARGEVPAIRIGRTIRIGRAALDRLLTGSGDGGVEEPVQDSVVSSSGRPYARR
jgi:excisionase family DNA binding protein